MDLETTEIAAVTLNPAERLDTCVANLAAGAVNSAPQLAVENHATADASPQSKTDDSTMTAGRAFPQFAHRSGVGIVFNQDRSSELTGQRRSQIKPDNRRNVRSVHHQSGGGVNGSGNDHRNGLNGLVALGRVA